MAVEEEYEDEELDDEEIEEEESEEEEEQEEIEEEIEAEERAQKRRDANRLKKISKTAPYRFYPHFNKEEQKLMNRLKKSGHAMEIARMNQLMAQRKQAFWGKVKTVVSAAAPFIGIMALIILIVIVVIVFVATLFPWLFPDDETGSSKGAASPFGMKGDKFYGARAVYKDETLSRNGLIEQYVDIVQSSVDNLQGKIYTETIEEETYDVKLTVNLTLPAEDYDFENMELLQFATDYAELYNIVVEIANFVYAEDNEGAVAPAEIETTLDGIPYFGFSADMIGSTIDEDKEVDNNIIEIVYDALTETGVITFQEKPQSAEEFGASSNVTMENLDDDIREELISTINVDSNKVRAEKLFIKDFILEDAESYIEGIEKKNYVALIYMPKEVVNFNYVSYMITVDKTAEFSMILTNNGNKISLTKGEGENWSDDDNATELTYTFKSSENLNQTMNIFDAINTAELNKFTTGSSLAKVITETGDYNVYLEENEEGILTYKKGSMYLTFESDKPFMFNEELEY